MNNAAANILLLDLGSHSAKAYLKSDRLESIGNTTWTLLEGRPSQLGVETSLRGLVTPFRSRCKKLIAVGTEAMRRSPEISRIVGQACRNLGISYRTLSQGEEAHLIRKAMPDNSDYDLINAGGGSIQIISTASTKMTLLGFGISDLNKAFDLTAEPEHRQIGKCIDWVTSQLPDGLAQFVYTGGEEKYLRHLGVPLTGGRCSRKDFETLSVRLSRLPMEELQTLSPLDPKWMSGAIASNCIVLACLRKSGADLFIPSNLNIAHGLIHELLADDAEEA